MPAPDLVTYISHADLRTDGGTVRAGLRLVLPGQLPGTPPSSGSSGGRRLVLAGDWSYPPNQDGLKWFWRRVLPLLSPELERGSIPVDVFGTAVPRLRSITLRHLGHADDVRDLYRTGDVHIAPVRFGGGVKRKVLQPLLSGLPVVTTPAGARGLRDHPLLDVRSSPDAFADSVLRRLAGPTALAPAHAADLVDADDTDQVVRWLGA